MPQTPRVKNVALPSKTKHKNGPGQQTSHVEPLYPLGYVYLGVPPLPQLSPAFLLPLTSLTWPQVESVRMRGVLSLSLSVAGEIWL